MGGLGGSDTNGPGRNEEMTTNRKRAFEGGGAVLRPGSKREGNGGKAPITPCPPYSHPAAPPHPRSLPTGGGGGAGRRRARPHGLAPTPVFHKEVGSTRLSRKSRGSRRGASASTRPTWAIPATPPPPNSPSSVHAAQASPGLGWGGLGAALGVADGLRLAAQAPPARLPFGVFTRISLISTKGRQPPTDAHLSCGLARSGLCGRHRANELQRKGHRRHLPRENYPAISLSVEIMDSTNYFCLSRTHTAHRCEKID